MKHQEKSISSALIAKIAEENPDLTPQFIQNILIAQQEALAGNCIVYNKIIISADNMLITCR